jgi:hypothetical protein
MTESEAINILKMVETHGSLTTKAKDMAIKALEEMAKIKEMGDCYIIPKNGVWEVNGIDIHKAIEKQIAKKPNKAIDTSWGVHKEVNVCPVCDCFLTEVQFIDCDETKEGKRISYCETCGQAIDWK